jgi:hypothetical protein
LRFRNTQSSPPPPNVPLPVRVVGNISCGESDWVIVGKRGHRSRGPKDDVLKIGQAGEQQLVAVKEQGEERGLAALFEQSIGTQHTLDALLILLEESR